MDKSEKGNFLTELRRVFWPIEWHENKKFIPMALMMACILFNYATVRSIKDGLVVTHIGPEAISFLKTYVVLPSAVIFMILYVQKPKSMDFKDFKDLTCADAQIFRF